MCCIDNLFLQQSYFPYYSMNTISSDKHLPVVINKDESKYIPFPASNPPMPSFRKQNPS